MPRSPDERNTTFPNMKNKVTKVSLFYHTIFFGSFVLFSLNYLIPLFF